MQNLKVNQLLTTLCLSASLALIACSDQASTEVGDKDKSISKMNAEDVAELGDVIARVGDQEITFNQINTMLNSSAVVGVSVPALGTPQRDTARIVVLDKVVSANLLYLDALRKGLDKDPVYVRAMESFTDGMLGGQYHRQVVAADITVSEQEIQDFFSQVMEPGVEMDDDLHTQIEATLRKRKLHERLVAERAKLREGIDVRVFPENLAPEQDDAATDMKPVAKYGDQVITWGEVKTTLIAAGLGAVNVDPLAMESDAQLATLQTLIDKRIIAARAREAGLEKDPTYQARLSEYRKTRLINLHRASLAREMEPTDEQLEQYYNDNRNRIMQVEMRKLQEVLVKTEDEAEALKNRIESGEMTMFQVAAGQSIAPGAKQNLGEVGWVAQGRAQPALDEIIFELEPGEIGGPVESTEGWHLFKVLDVADAKFDDFRDGETRKLTRRRYIHDRLNSYVADLRTNAFEVEVYENNIVRLAQIEADMVAKLSEEATKPGSKTEQRIEELNKLVGE